MVDGLRTRSICRSSITCGTAAKFVGGWWQVLRLLPPEELTRLDRRQVDHYIEGAEDA